MRALTLLLAVLALALVGAGCGGGDDEASGDTDTVLTDTVTTDTETDTEETTIEDFDTSGLDAFASEECLELVNAGLALSQAFTAASGGGGDLDEAAELFDRLVDKAPSEIRADLQVMAQFFAEYAEVLQRVDLQEGEIPSAEQVQELQSALAAIDQPELQAASERLSAWASTNCPGG